MKFRDNQAIYLQIAEYVCEQILVRKWHLGAKVLSIRELAIEMEVNPNTVQRSYDLLQQRQIIINKRGVGYFVDEDALERILSFKREQFVQHELPAFFRNLYLLKMDLKEVKQLYEEFINDTFKLNKK